LTAALVLGLAHLAGWAEHEIISLVSSTFLVLYVLVVLAALRLLSQTRERAVAALTLAVLLIMASFYAAATVLTASLLFLFVVGHGVGSRTSRQMPLRPSEFVK
jgi:ABC-type multidrug transport system permease subunit